jgi:hypothetical protein
MSYHFFTVRPNRGGSEFLITLSYSPHLTMSYPFHSTLPFPSSSLLFLILPSPLHSALPSISQHTLVKKRHETLLKAFGRFEQYKHTRLSVTKYSISKDGRPIPGSVISEIPSRYSNSISSISSTPSSCILVDHGSSGGAMSVDNELGIDSTETQNKTEGKEKEGEKEKKKEREKEKEKVLNTIEMETDYDYDLDTPCVKNHHRSAPHADPELQSENISDEALLQEVHFNYGRAYRFLI